MRRNLALRTLGQRRARVFGVRRCHIQCKRTRPAKELCYCDRERGEAVPGQLDELGSRRPRAEELGEREHGVDRGRADQTLALSFTATTTGHAWDVGWSSIAASAT